MNPAAKDADRADQQAPVHEPADDATPEAKAKPKRPWRRRLIRAAVVTASITALVLILAAIHIPTPNPAYPATNKEIRQDLSRMRAEPVTLDRPVLVLSGYRSPMGSSLHVANRLRSLTGADERTVVPFAYFSASSIHDAARRAAAFAAERWPGATPGQTAEIDVVAISMGGLVARLAAQDPAGWAEHEHEPLPRLNIRRLYTLATPHRGASLAQLIHVDRAAKDMRPGSDFLDRLNAPFRERQPPDYELTCYAVLRDAWVGATRAAPPGQDPIWVPGRIVMSHLLVSLEDRILADIARRLRGEQPLAEPSTPPRD